MLHSKRIWTLTEVETPQELACELTQFAWTGCRAMVLQGYVFANDSTSPNGVQEYAILKPHSSGGALVQIESITFSWCSEDHALELITRICAGMFDGFEHVRIRREQFQTRAEHRFCNLCC